MSEHQIKILSDREHVIKRPAMYIGSVSSEPHERFLFGEYKTITYVPGLVKIIDEIIDNSIDEAIRTEFKFANEIEVTVDGTKVTVKDNGRGIPQADVITPEGESIPGPVAAWTRTKAGGNFGNDAERNTGGMNGVGSSLTNFFSTWFEGCTCDGKNTVTVTCNENAENIHHKITKGKVKGTSVSFIPDFDHFDCIGIDKTVQDIIQDRLMTLSIIFPDINFKFNGKKVQSNFKKYSAQYGEKVIVCENDNVSIAITSSDDGFRHLSFVNQIHTKNGGSHVEWIMDEISAVLIPAIKRKYRIEVTKARIKECLTLLVFARNMKNMKFDSQTKERLTNTAGEVKNHFDIDVQKLSNQIMKTEEVLMPIIESALARKLAAEQAALTKANKKAAKQKIAKHIKANLYGKDAETTLFLTEGDSAINELLSTRNQDLHGGYPLRGKFKTTWGMNPVDILKNKEAFDIVSILGLEFGKPPEDLFYKNIAIMTDADVDGQGSIYPSLLAFFAHWPELYEQGRIRFCKTPLIIIEKGKEQKWYYNDEEYSEEKDKLKGWSAPRYIKGLASLKTEEYRKVINEPFYDVVELPENYKDLFELVFGKDSDARKEWMK